MQRERRIRPEELMNPDLVREMVLVGQRPSDCCQLVVCP
jgi:hypothetical protein